MMLLLLIMLRLSQMKENPEYNPDYSGYDQCRDKESFESQQMPVSQSYCVGDKRHDDCT